MAGLFGYAMSFIIARFRHLALIMITLGLGLLLHEAANTASWLTGGSDGLQGVSIGPLLGIFRFDLYGYTAYAYSLSVLFVVFLLVRRLVNSPFGLALRGIRENPIRMPAIGAPSRAPYSHDLHHCRRDCRHRRGAARADDQHRLAWRAGFSALGRRAGDPGSRRRRPPLRRDRRRHHLHGRARSVLGHQSAVLVLLDRPAARRRCDVPAERGARRTCAADCGAGGARRRECTAAQAPALSTHGLDKSFGSLVVAKDITFACRKARATR